MATKNLFKGIRIKQEMAETGWEKLQKVATRLDKILINCGKKKPKFYGSVRITCGGCPLKLECLPLKSIYNRLLKKLQRREQITPLELKEEGLPKRFRY